MKKKIFSILLACALILPNFSYSFAAEAPVEPIIPTEQTEENVDQYNKEVDKYNEEVDKYNQQIDEDYEAAQAEYEKQKEDTQIHNQEEEDKVKENEEQLAKQERINQRIEHDTNNGLENSTDDPEKAPKNFDGETTDPKTIIVEKSDDPTGKTHKYMGLHVFTEDGDFFNDNDFSNDSIKIAESLLNKAILIEWEIVTADENDIIYSLSQDVMWGGKQMQFRRCLEGYVNGVWLASSYTIESDANNQGIDFIGNTWAQYVSYNEGTHYNRTPINTVLLWVYYFYRVGPEPEEVVKYEPDIWDDPIAPIKPDYLTKLNYLIFVPTDDDPVTPVTPTDTDDPTPSPTQKEKVVEKTKVVEKKTSNNDRRAVAVVYRPVITANATTEKVKDEKTPKVKVAENTTPKTKGETAYWALINLIAVILTIIVNLIIFIRFVVKKHEKALKVFFGLIVSIISVLVFIFTENMLNPMILVDRWTLLMIIFLIINIILLIKRKKKDDEEEEEESIDEI